jgi:hypothetical protein
VGRLDALRGADDPRSRQAPRVAGPRHLDVEEVALGQIAHQRDALRQPGLHIGGGQVELRRAVRV